MKLRFLSKEKLIKVSSYDIIAVAGPMASGKNYICSLLEKYDFISIDADKTVHRAIEMAAPEILGTFSETASKMGVNIKNKDGTLNRKALGSIVFSDKKLLKKQEDIVYPVILDLINDFIKSNPKKRIIINATVLYKTPALMDKCQIILYVTAPFFTRLRRARKRDRMPFREILKRFFVQRNLLKEYKKTGKEIIIIRNSKKHNI